MMVAMVDDGITPAQGRTPTVCRYPRGGQPVDFETLLRFNALSRERDSLRSPEPAGSLFPDVGMMAQDLPLSAVDLFRALPDATCLVDSDGRICAANPDARQLLGIPPDATPPPRLQTFCSDADRAVIDRLIYRTLRFGEHDCIPFQLETAAGRSLTIELSAHDTADPGYAVIVLRPHRTGSQEQDWLQEQTRLHYQRGEELHQTAITIGHNLKVPVVTMEANLALMERALASGELDAVRGDLAAIKAAAHRLRTTLDELLELGRLRRYDLTTLAGVPDAPAESLDDVVAETLRLMSATISQSPAKIEVQTSLPKARMRRRLLIEVFQNLISNALKFGARVEMPVIQIGVEDRPEGKVAFVRDNGPGIAVEDRERVFLLFSRLDSKIAGAGAGLAIVRRILLAYESKVWVEEGIGGQGTSICFTLPFVDDAS